MRSPSRRCVLLFAHGPRAEARRKGLPSAEPLFRAVEQRVRRSVSRLPGVDLVCCGARRTGAPADQEIEQRGADFAERLANAFADARALGYDEIVVIPGDVPGLEGRQIVRAFHLLQRAPVVLGPSPDGGVYLIGCRGPAEALLQGVRWRTQHVRRDLQARAPGALLLAWRADVDRPADLARLRHDAGVPLELRALIESTPMPARSLAFAARAETSRIPAAPERPRGPPLLH